MLVIQEGSTELATRQSPFGTILVVAFLELTVNHRARTYNQFQIIASNRAMATSTDELGCNTINLSKASYTTRLPYLVLLPKQNGSDEKLRLQNVRDAMRCDAMRKLSSKWPTIAHGINLTA